MARPRRVRCKRCDRHIDECGPLSARGLCEDDSIAGVNSAIAQMSAGRGPIYDRYVAGLTRATERAQQRQRDSDVS